VPVVCSRAGAGKPRTVKALLPDAVRRRFDPAERYGLRVTLFAIAVVLVAVPFGILLEQVLRNGPMLRFDKGVAESAHRAVLRAGDGAVDVLQVVSWLGRPPFLATLVCVAALYCLRRGRIRVAIFLVVTGTVGGLVDTAVKVLVNRPRPVLDNPIAHAFGKSFPSGHAMSSTVVYGALLLVFLPALPRRARPPVVAATVALVLAICASRIALGVHFLSDVLGGLVLGLAWLLASVAAFRLWRTERGRRPAPVSAGVEPEAGRDLALHGSSG
jgi:membrane-associated phospholipid phosphatase